MVANIMALVLLFFIVVNKSFKYIPLFLIIMGGIYFSWYRKISDLSAPLKIRQAKRLKK